MDERIASLTPAQQLTLKVAAVLGRSFDLDLLAQVHPGRVPATTLTENIAAAMRRGTVANAVWRCGIGWHRQQLLVNGGCCTIRRRPCSG